MKAYVQIVIPVVALALLAGCSSANYEKGSATGAGLQASADKIGQGQAKIDAALKSLNDLVNNPSDLATQFKTYGTSVSDLESSAKDVSSKVASMRGKGDEYFKAWDAQAAQIKNEDIKNRSAQRKAEMQKKFTDIKMSYTEASELFKPFLSDLKDIQTALATDLTTGGVGAVKGAAEKANKDSVPVKASIDKLVAQFKDLGVAMQAAAPPPPPPK
jgi:predicted  nucleic acid-binding Zn-ribbon protein